MLAGLSSAGLRRLIALSASASVISTWDLLKLSKQVQKILDLIQMLGLENKWEASQPAAKQIAWILITLL